MAKIDYKKELGTLYRPSSKEVSLVEVPPLKYLMIDGEGDPNTSSAFHAAIECLYPLSYKIKFLSKKLSALNDYVVMPLEGLWWADDMTSFISGDKSKWQWTLMMMQPDHVDNGLFEEAFREVQAKKSPSALELVRFETYREGRSAQTMHLGPFSEEGPTVERVHKTIEENGFTPRGKHHEIYLSDMRRVDSSKWRTVLRQPYK